MKRTPRVKRIAALRTLCAAAALTVVCGSPLPALAQQNDAAAAARAEVGRMERYLNDSVLTARVKLALADAPDVSALDIGVQTHRGVVQLSGFVDGPRLVQRASEIATRVPGVVEVRNALQVKG